MERKNIELRHVSYQQNVERLNNPFIVCLYCEGYNKGTNKTV